MPINFLSSKTFSVLEKSLTASTLRHKAISNNIANVNTPKYKRKLVDFEEELKKCIGPREDCITIKTTNQKHITTGKRIEEIYPQIKEDNSTFLRNDKNNVDIDLELAILAENTIKFNVLSQSISKKFSMLRSVIKGG